MEDLLKGRAVTGPTAGGFIEVSSPPLTVQPLPLDVQVGGNHYKDMAIQPIEFCFQNKFNPCQTAVVKYVSRYKTKNGIEDLRKAKHYLELLALFEYGTIL